MTTHNILRISFAALVAAGVLPLSACVVFSAAPAPDMRFAIAAREGQQCERYVRERKGHPGKGVHTVKVVYVDCAKKK